MAKITLLDDLLSDEELARVNQQRLHAKRSDLSEFIPQPQTLTFGPPLELTMFLQVTTCDFCQFEHTLPLNVLVKHELFKGKRSLAFVSIPLAHPGEHSTLRVNQHIQRSTVPQCHLCFEEARKATPLIVHSIPPKPGTQRWLELYGTCRTEDIHELEKQLLDREEGDDRRDALALAQPSAAAAEAKESESFD